MAGLVLRAFRWIVFELSRQSDLLILPVPRGSLVHSIDHARLHTFNIHIFLTSIVLLQTAWIQTAKSANAAGAWSEPVKLGPNVNSDLYNHFPYVTVDGKRLYFSSLYGGINEDIYVCHWDSGLNDWGPKQVLPGTINTLERELSPCESPDGKYLWFTRWNGSRGYDVYYSTWDTNSGQWGLATNAGAAFNSPCNEWSVSISADSRRMFVAHDIRPDVVGCEGDVLWVSYWSDSLRWWDTLIWMGNVLNRTSSNAQACMSLDTALIWFASGGSWPGVEKCGSSFDVFSVSNNPPFWNVVANPGKPLNSFDNEWSVGVSADGRQLYFSSWRDTLTNKLEIFVSEWQESTGVREYQESGGDAVAVRAMPNPFNEGTEISVTVQTPSTLRIDVFDLLGRIAANVYSGTVQAGTRHFRWSPSPKPTGIYLVRVSTGTTQVYRKLLYLK